MNSREPIHEDGMVSMSILGHMEELRMRIIRALMGFGIVYLLCICFSDKLWLIVQAPAADALKTLGIKHGMVIIDPMEAFSIIWMWTPLVAAIFLGSPWILYQVWAFIAPGLYQRERRWAVPFVLATAGLFLAGACFAYFVALPFGLAFLLGIGRSVAVDAMISIDVYFSRFVDVMLGVSLMFELPLVIFLLTLLRLASPRFLFANSRYAILAIVTVAAIVTPT
jgi:sec-independent protein translocase protein TatC